MVCLLLFFPSHLTHCTITKDPDSSKVTKATRDLFMTESAQVRFGASLDALKNSWESRKASDSEKIREQKVCSQLLMQIYWVTQIISQKKEENRVGGAILRDAMKKTWQRNMLTNPVLKSECIDDAGLADSSFNAADDELSVGSDKDENKENSRANVTTRSLKRKAQVIDLISSEDEAKPAAAKNMKKSRHIKSNEPSFDWNKHFREERESRSRFEADLKDMYREGMKHNKDMVDLMKSAQEDNRTFQNSLLDLLSRKL